MRKFIIVLFALVLVPGFSLMTATPALAAARTASVSGNWSNPATWGGSVPPVTGDTITINSGITVTVDVATTCASLTLAAVNASSIVAISGTGQLNVEL